MEIIMGVLSYEILKKTMWWRLDVVVNVDYCKKNRFQVDVKHYYIIF
jgi:hypothetical protein